MNLQKISDRNYIVRYHLEEWDLNLHCILGDKNNYVIDTGLGSDSVAPFLELLASSQKPTVVINTHYHWDHVWGNHCFPNSIILSHPLCRERIAENWKQTLDEHPHYIRGDAEMCLPNLVFDSELYFPDDGIRLLHTPGHTQDGICVFDEKDRILNVGDNIGDTVEAILPDLETDHQTYLASIQTYRELGATACVSGHNKVLGPEIFQRIVSSLSTEPK